MHTRGHIHADLHLGNILLEFPKTTSDTSPDKLFETFGNPVLELVRIIGNGKEQPLPVGIPSHIVIPAWFGTRSEDVKLGEASVMLADFGEAFTPYRQKPDLHWKSQSFAADIWTLACSIWNILEQWPLVDIFSFTDDYVTREQVDALGRLPEAWSARWDTRSQYFDSQGTLSAQIGKRRSLEVWFEDSIQLPRR